MPELEGKLLDCQAPDASLSSIINGETHELYHLENEPLET